MKPKIGDTPSDTRLLFGHSAHQRRQYLPALPLQEQIGNRGDGTRLGLTSMTVAPARLAINGNWAAG